MTSGAVAGEAVTSSPMASGTTAARLTDLGELADELASWPEAAGGDTCLARTRIADACVAYLATAASAPAGGPLPSRALSAAAPDGIARSLAARIRYSEIDDILLETCVTPGSVAIPALFAAAWVRPETSPARLAAAVAAGYASLGLCGSLLGGATAVARGGWPTRAAGLAWHGKPAEPAREIVFGWVVETGVRCALLAADGVVGDAAALTRWPHDDDQTGTHSTRTLDVTAIASARIKPLCSARQLLPALTCLLAVTAEQAGPDEITGIDVYLSRPCLAFADRPRVVTRLDSIASIQYQAAAALWAPRTLWDVTRDELSLLARARETAALLRLHEDPELTRQYPARWPARVTVTTRRGTITRADDDLPDTAGDPLAAVREKAARLFPPGTGTRLACDAAIERCLAFGNGAELTAVLGSIDETKEAHAS
jgi:2-methylcitrate dehydratase PrpD